MAVNEAISSTKTEDDEIQVDAYEEKQSESDTGEILNEDESNDLEDGEIPDNSNAEQISVCRFFKRGACFYGSHCHYRHISDQVYNMFQHGNYGKRNLNIIQPLLFPQPEIIHPHATQPKQDIEIAWEEGLEKAKSMIERAISKRKEDKEFETKKLFISTKNSKCDNPRERDSSLRANSLNKFSLSYNQKSMKSLSPEKVVKLKHDKRKDDYKPKHVYEKSNYHCKWVDPWMRSRSPRKRMWSRSQSVSPSSSLSSKKKCYHASSDSSASTYERYASPMSNKKICKKGSANALFDKTRSNKQSLSRSSSRSFSRSGSRKRCRSHSSSLSESSSASSYSPKKTEKRLPLEKLFFMSHSSGHKNMKEKKVSVSPKRLCRRQDGFFSRSSSLSSVPLFRTENSSRYDSDGESSSSMTVASIVCSSRSSSCDSCKSQMHSIKDDSARVQEVADSPTATNSESHNLPRYKETLPSGKRPPIEPIRKISSEKKDYPSTRKQSSSEEETKSVERNSESQSFYAKSKEVHSYSVSSKNKCVSKHGIETSAHKKKLNDSLSSLANSLLRYQAVARKNNLTFIHQINKSVSNPKNLKTDSKPESKLLEAKVVKDLPVVENRPSKRTITLNLQPKSQKIVKQPDEHRKIQDSSVNVSNNEKRALNRREALLKQLKLVEEAIARKKQ